MYYIIWGTHKCGDNKGKIKFETVGNIFKTLKILIAAGKNNLIKF